MIRATQTKGAPIWGLLGCALLVVVGGACTDDKADKPTVTASGTVVLADHGVGLLTETKNGEPCFELRTGATKGSRDELAQYGCMQAQDGLTSNFLVNNNQLAVGGAVAPSVVTVTVNNQPTHRDGPYFLAVLPTVPDGDVNVVATDKDGKVVVSQQYSKALVTSQQTPAIPAKP